MAEAKNIVIKDGKAVPVDHTFVPSRVSELKTTYFGPGTTLSGRESIVIDRREATQSVAGKVTIKLVTPVEIVVDGQSTVSHQDLASVDFVLAPKSDADERRDLRVLFANLLLNGEIADVIDNGNGIF